MAFPAITLTGSLSLRKQEVNTKMRLSIYRQKNARLNKIDLWKINGQNLLHKQNFMNCYITLFECVKSEAEGRNLIRELKSTKSQIRVERYFKYCVSI